MEDLNQIIDEIMDDRYRTYKKYSRGGMKMKERLKSPVFWTQLVLLVAEALKLFGVYEISNEMLSNLQDIITLVFQVFSGLNNPTDRENF